MIQLARIFQDGMTLQRQKPIRIWGNTDCSQQISVYLNGKELLSDVSIENDFSLELPAQEAAIDATLTITGSSDVVELKNVDIGEVWVAGGQSNMEFLLRYEEEGETQIKSANDVHLRFYDVGEYSFPEEESYTKKENACWHKWVPFVPEWAEYFSSVGLYFAKDLRETLDVPVAIVGCNWGGTTASSWTEESYLAADEDLKSYLDDYEKVREDQDVEAYNRRHDEALEFMATPAMEIAMQKVLKGDLTLWDNIRAIPIIIKITKHPMPMGPRNHNSPGCLYRMMVKQIAGFTSRGVIWYQGESDDIKAEMYDKLFSTMIRCWRDTWQDELPFFFVQLAPYGNWMGSTGEKYPILRQKQEWVSKNVPNTYMASIMDSGMEKDIHPKNKRVVGERLALLARKNIYGENILCEAPEYESAEVKDGELKLYFTHVGEGLHILGKQLNALELVVDGELVTKYKAFAKDNALSIKAEQIKKASQVNVNFAWTGYCEVNLYNSANLSAKPFQMHR
ncbi:MAG: hypothetical protein IJP06_06320 [Agathobacter sp.]|nr:hypothetical protein [Agathobacter sp.]